MSGCPSNSFHATEENAVANDYNVFYSSTQKEQSHDILDVFMEFHRQTGFNTGLLGKHTVLTKNCELMICLFILESPIDLRKLMFLYNLLSSPTSAALILEMFLCYGITPILQILLFKHECRSIRYIVRLLVIQETILKYANKSLIPIIPT